MKSFTYYDEAFTVTNWLNMQLNIRGYLVAYTTDGKVIEIFSDITNDEKNQFKACTIYRDSREWERVSIYKVYASLESYETKLNSFKQVDKV